jgi:hypothetical protein
LTEWSWNALALHDHLAALRLLGGGLISFAEDEFKHIASFILNDICVEVEIVDPEELLIQHLHELAMATHPLHALFSE